MAAVPEKIYSAEEYLALEEKAQTKSEYYYVLIDQSRPFVEYFHRADSGEWIYEALNHINQSLKLRSLDVEIP